jgi:hypothetical protein
VAAQGAAALSAAGRAMGAGGFFPPMGMGMSPGEDEERRRSSNLPNVDNSRLFALDERPSAPVIGDVTDKERSVEL